MEKLDVKVGDIVILSCGNNPDRLVKVTKITPSGRIRIDNRDDIQFTPDGREMGKRDRWSWTSYLYPATPERIEEIKQNSIIRKAYYAMNTAKNLSYEQAVQILKILES